MQPEPGDLGQDAMSFVTRCLAPRSQHPALAEEDRSHQWYRTGLAQPKRHTPDAIAHPGSRSASAKNHDVGLPLQGQGEASSVPIGIGAAAESPDSSDEDLRAFVQRTIAEWELTEQHPRALTQYPGLLRCSTL